MKRRFPGLHQAAQPAEVPEGLYLVRVQRAQYRWHPQKPYYAVQFEGVEPKPFAGSPICGRIYCTHYEKGAPLEVGCGCWDEQSTTPNERNTLWTV